MPTSKSAKKRVRQSEIRRLRNRGVKSEVRTRIKQVEAAIRDRDAGRARAAYQAMEARLDKAARKGVIHVNEASRRKSRLRKRINRLAATPPSGETAS